MQSVSGKLSIFLFFVIGGVHTAVFKAGQPANFSYNAIFRDGCEADLRAYHYGLIFPGTKWCGDGDVANGFDDLGYFKNTDKCCRAHDHCNDILLSGESNHGLTNNGKFTLLHCQCDSAFFDCLGKTDCKVSGIVAISYFNVLGAQCFDFKPPATCVEFDNILGFRERCAKYKFDSNRLNEWQWFDLPRWIFGP